jgi:hypothetical protein
VAESAPYSTLSHTTRRTRDYASRVTSTSTIIREVPGPE